jgi:hypothetical protein
MLYILNSMMVQRRPDLSETTAASSSVSCSASRNLGQYGLAIAYQFAADVSDN